ncbi:hypothetical protein FRC12_022481 [Ceratobasidium sp. 428]|nr:hypothetical protein FRC12_022481 [Ceratobasidium sp. 428]
MMYSPLNPNLAQIMLLDTAYILFRFIETLCTPRVENCIPMVVNAALERIWLECDRERAGFMAPNRRGFTRQFSGWLFGRLCCIRESLTTQAGRTAFAQAALVDSNIIGIAGRTLLMMAMDNTEPEMWTNMLDGLSHLHDLMTMMLSAGAINFVLTGVVEWKKVWSQLHDLRNGSAPTSVPIKYIEEAIKAWEPMGPTKEDTEICSHPRCPTFTIDAKPMETAFVCSRCCMAKYCSVRCQIRHWRLGTAESHANKCIPLRFAGLGVSRLDVSPRKYFFKFDVSLATLKQRPDYQDIRKYIK